MTIFIASTRAKKLKKLRNLASNIINEYGYCYFIRVAFYEFRRQKFKLFFPDPENKITLEQTMHIDEVRKYEKFNKENSLKDDEIKEIYSKLNFKPKFTIIINYDRKNIKLTLESIKKQVYTNYTIVIFSPDDKNENDLQLDNSQEIKFVSKINDFLANSDDDFICLLDSGTTLTSDALFRIYEFLNQVNDTEIIYADNDYFETKFSTRVIPFFKPDWSPYLFYNMNYLRPFCIIKKEILEKIELDAISNIMPFYDIILLSIEITTKIMHYNFPISTIHQENMSETYFEEGKNLLSNHLNRKKNLGTVSRGILPNTYRIRYANETEPLVSILIPTRNNEKILQRCIKSLENNTTYKNWEIIIIDNNSTKNETKEYYESLPYKIISFSEPFNFSKMNNLAVKHTKGELLLFLNDDTQIINPESLQEMVNLCCQNDVGAVGAKLVYADETIQHAGIAFLQTGAGFHPFQRINEAKGGYHNLINVTRECSAVTGACLLVKKEIFDQVNQFDEDFDLYYGDADLCLKIIKAGYNVLYNPHAKLLHEGSYSIQKQTYMHFAIENHFQFMQKWPYLKDGDPFYNVNLDWNYSLRLIE